MLFAIFSLVHLNDFLHHDKTLYTFVCDLLNVKAFAFIRKWY